MVSITENVIHWNHAARVLKGLEPPQKAPRQPDTPSLEDWLIGPEGQAAKELLAAGDHEIDLGYSETVMSSTNAVVFTSNGFVSHSGVVGMAAAYTNEEPQRESIEPAEAVQRAIDYEYDEIQSEADVVTFLRNALNDYAEGIQERAREAAAQAAARDAARSKGEFVSSRTS